VKDKKRFLLFFGHQN